MGMFLLFFLFLIVGLLNKSQHRTKSGYSIYNCCYWPKTLNSKEKFKVLFCLLQQDVRNVWLNSGWDSALKISACWLKKTYKSAQYRIGVIKEPQNIFVSWSLLFCQSNTEADMNALTFYLFLLSVAHFCYIYEAKPCKLIWLETQYEVRCKTTYFVARKQQLYLGPWSTKINSNVKNRMFWMRCKVHHSKVLRVFGSYSVHSVAYGRSERVNVFWNCFIYPASGPTGPGFLHHRVLWNTVLWSG